MSPSISVRCMPTFSVEAMEDAVTSQKLRSSSYIILYAMQMTTKIDIIMFDGNSRSSEKDILMIS